MNRTTRWALLALFLVSIALIAAVIVLSSPSRKAAPTVAVQATSASAKPGLVTVAAEMTAGAASAPTSAIQASLGPRTKTSGCVAKGSLPDPACTPGEVLSTDSRAICAPGYAGNTRDVTSSTKAQVYAEYGIASHVAGEYEVDHLISLELGGSNGIANLWPEAANGSPGFHEKDKVENFLHGEVCSGAITLRQAQYEIATNWVGIYEAMSP